MPYALIRYKLRRIFDALALSLAAVIWNAMYSHRPFLVLMRATARDAKNSIQSIKTILENSEPLKAAFPEIIAPIVALQGSPRKAGSQTCNGGERTRITYAIDKIVFPSVKGTMARGQILYAVGCESSIRGLCFATLDETGKTVLTRPSCIVMDDLEGDEQSHARSSIERLNRIVSKDVAGLPAAGRDLAQIMLCTILSKGCLADRYTDPNNTDTAIWTKRRYAALLQYPERMDLWEEYAEKRKDDPTEATRFYADNRTEMDRGASVLWEARYNRERGELSALQSLMDYRQTHGEASFKTEMLNEPPDEMAVVETHLSTKQITRKTVSVPRGVIPNSHRDVVSVGVDLGRHLLHYSVMAFNKNIGSAHVADYGVIDVPNFPDVGHSVMKALSVLQDSVLFPGWKDEDGNTRGANIVMLDSGWQSPVVYAFCAGRFGKMKPCKGHSDYGATKNGVLLSKYYLPKDLKSGVLPGDNLYINLVHNAIVCHINVDYYKDNLIERWKLDHDTPGSLTLFDAPWQEHIRFSSHQCSEHLEETMTKTGLRKSWRRISKANHWLDSTVLALAGVNALEAGKPVKHRQGTRTISDAGTPPPVAPTPAPSAPPLPRPLKPRRVRPVKVRYGRGAGPLPF